MTLDAPLRRIEALVFRYPVKLAVRTSFGLMRDRPAVFIRVEDADGAVGWGEAWCNFPSVAAEHRARLVQDVLAPLLIGRRLQTPSAAFEELTARTAVLAIQSGEHGPLAQAIAGLDIALWDLAARRAREPLWRWLGGASPEVRVYASGINPSEPEVTAEAAMQAGHRAFKLKIGFGADLDRRNLAAIRERIGPSCMLAADANQAWTSAEALAIAPTLAPFGLAWLEEPLRADRPWSEWRDLGRATGIPLAAGENLAGASAFAAASEEGGLAVVQPDLAKWGGFTGCLPVARRILAGGARFCPHFLGGGIGLLASAHLLAAVGGDGLLEVDVNDNPLRDVPAGEAAVVEAGCIRLSDRPGLGIEPNLAALDEYRAMSTSSEDDHQEARERT